MSRTMLWEDVNLASLAVSSDGWSVVMDFLDMYEGNPIGTLQCEGYFYLNTQHCFDDQDDCFACYIGEVVCEASEDDSLRACLARHGVEQPYLPTDEFAGQKVSLSLFWLCLQSGQIQINIGCRNIFCPLPGARNKTESRATPQH